MKYITNFLDKFIFALACVLTAVLLSENGAPSKICSESGHDYGSFVPYPLHDLLRLWAFHAPDEDAPSYHSHSQRLHVSGGTGVQRYHGPVFSGRAY